MGNEELIIDSESIHNWFGLSYANYFVMGRSILQFMPQAWQHNFIRLIEEIPEILQVDDMPHYRVSAVSESGKFVTCPFRDYERGSRKIARK